MAFDAQRPGFVAVSTRPEAADVRLRLTIEPLIWPALVVIGAAARLAALGTLPLRAPDGARAFAAWQVAQGRLPATWNGDLVQTLTAAFFKVSGAGDGHARLAAALLGTATIAAFWLLRPAVGRVPTFLAALFFALSPVCVATARSLSPYSAGVLFVIVAAALFLSFLEQPRAAPLAYLAFVLGLGFSTDAAFIVFLLIAATFSLVEGRWRRDQVFVRAAEYLREHRDLFLGLLPIWAAGFLLSVARFGIAPDRLRSGAMASFSSAFNPVLRAEPWHFPLVVLAGYEPLLLIAGGIETVVLVLAWRKLAFVERFLLYWLIGALLFNLLTLQPEMGQLVLLIAALALIAGRGFDRWLSRAVWDELRSAFLPAMVAIPPLVYVLFVLETATHPNGISGNQSIALILLFLGALVLLTLGAVWSRGSITAFAGACGLLFGLAFALHAMTAVGFGTGDEFLVGPTATLEARGLGDEVVRIVPNLNGRISLAQSLADPMLWYTRAAGDAVQVEPANRASGGILQPANQPVPPSFRALITNNEIEHSWYPGTFDAGGILRWILYRQAWGHVEQTSVTFLVGQSP